MKTLEERQAARKLNRERAAQFPGFPHVDEEYPEMEEGDETKPAKPTTAAGAKKEGGVAFGAKK